MGNKFITEISLEDFLKLNLIGYRNGRVDVDEHSYRMEMLPLELNKEILDNVEFCKENGWNTIVVAIHNEPTKEDIEAEKRTFTLDKKTHERRNLNDEEAYKFALLDCSYLDKFMNRFSGHQTFQIGCGIDHLYSNRDYWYAAEDYWRVKKKETKSIYLIHLS